MTRVAAAIVLALLTACASDPVWTHPTKDRDELKADAADCERFFSGVEKDQENCMKLKGWRRVKK
jgi:hypothetical protein